MQNDEVTATYLYGTNLLSTNNGTSTNYYLFNAHGDVTGIADDAQAVTKTYDYDAFGSEINPSATDTNPFRYCGEYYDTETGTYYLRARYYDPSIGRFTQQDSVQYTEKSLPTGNITDPLSLNYYTYSANNPILYCDPSGNAWETVFDVVSLVESTSSLLADPSIQNAVFFTWDVASVVLPFVPGSYLAKGAKLLSKSDEAFDLAKTLLKVNRAGNSVEFITTVKKGTDIVQLAKNEKYLVGSYNDMKAYTKGYNHAVEAHHILEQRIFKDKFNTGEMLSVVIPGDLHKQFTKRWSEIIPKNSNYRDILNNSEKLEEAINYVYKDHIELLTLAEDYLDSLKLGGK